MSNSRPLTEDEITALRALVVRVRMVCGQRDRWADQPAAGIEALDQPTPGWPRDATPIDKYIRLWGLLIQQELEARRGGFR